MVGLLLVVGLLLLDGDMFRDGPPGKSDDMTN